MVCTYTGDPSSSDRDAVRFLIGDTDCTNPLLQDAEIDYVISVEPTVGQAAATCARAIAGSFARYADKEVGDLKLKFSQRSQTYFDLADKLETQDAASVGLPYAGGISKTDKENKRDDTDRVEPSIYRAIHDARGGISEQDDSYEDEGFCR